MSTTSSTQKPSPDHLAALTHITRKSASEPRPLPHRPDSDPEEFDAGLPWSAVVTGHYDHDS